MHGPTRWFLGHSFESAGTPKVPTIEPPPMDRKQDPKKDNKATDTIKIDPAPVPKKEAEMTPEEKSRSDAVKEKMSGGPKPIPLESLPTMAKLLTSVPRGVFVFYVFFSSGVTFALCSVIYLGILKPSIIAQYRKQK